MLAAVLAAGFWYILETLGWKTVNPGQDYDDLETQALDPRKKTLRPNIYVSGIENFKRVNTPQSETLVQSEDSRTTRDTVARRGQAI